jgi:hypothetical protein
MGFWSHEEIESKFLRKINKIPVTDLIDFYRWRKLKAPTLLTADRFNYLFETYKRDQSQHKEVLAELLPHSIANISLIAVCLCNSDVPLHDLVSEGTKAVAYSLDKNLDRSTYFVSHFLNDVKENTQFLQRRYKEMNEHIIHLPPNIYKAAVQVLKADSHKEDPLVSLAKNKDAIGRENEIIFIARNPTISVHSNLPNSKFTYLDVIASETTKETSEARWMRSLLFKLSRPEEELPAHLRPFALSKIQAEILLSVRGGLLSRPEILANQDQLLKEGKITAENLLTEDKIAKAVSRGEKTLKAYAKEFPKPCGRLTRRTSRSIQLN